MARLPLLLLAAVMVQLAAPAVHAGDDLESRPLKFARHASSATVKSTLQGRQTIDDTLSARSGQTMSVTLVSPNGGLGFNVLPPGSKDVAMPDAIGRQSWQGSLPDDGEYRIRTYLVRAAARRGELHAMPPHGAWLDCSASDGKELAEMTQPARAAWMAKHPSPASVRFYSVAALADPARTAPALRAFRAELADIDPGNDGQMIAADAMLPGSSLLAQARADHWGIALPLDRHPAWTVRTLASGDRFPREALLRALPWWAAAD